MMKQNLNWQNKFSGFTLVEVIIYFGILIFVLSMVVQIVVPFFKTSTLTKEQTTLRQEIAYLVEKITSQAKASKNIYVTSDWILSFEKPENRTYLRFAKSAFLDQNNDLMGFMNNWFIGSISFNCRNFTSTCSTYKVWYNNSNKRLEGWAWSPIIGWVHFNTTTYSVNFNSSTHEFYGYAWNDVIGWIKFNCNENGNSSLCQNKWAVKLNESYLTGYAWNDTVGWIIFDGKNQNVYFKDSSQDGELISEKIFFDEVKFEKVNSSINGYFKASISDRKEFSIQNYINLIPGNLR